MRLTIGFSKSNKRFPLFSWLIRAYLRAPYSHVYILLPPTENRSEIIFHASEGLVHNISPSNFNKKHQKVSEFDIIMTKLEFDKVKTELLELSGSDYGILQTAFLPIARLLNIRNPFKKGVNCSEFVLKMLKKQIVTNIHEDVVTPKDIFQILESTTIYRRNFL